MSYFTHGSYRTVKLNKSRPYLKQLGLFLCVCISFFTASSGSALAVAFQDSQDPIVIRGPAGSENTDVRRGTIYHGPVQATETLWSIANRYKPHSSVSAAQMMAAIILANPEAFKESNPNELLTGASLRIPSLQEVQMINPEAAKRQIELGEQLERSQLILSQQENLVRQRQQEQENLIEETRKKTEQAIEDVRAGHETEFTTLKEELLRTIEGTEHVIRDNETIKERLASLEAILTQLQEATVGLAQYEQEMGELKALQDKLEKEQAIVRAKTEEKGLVEQLLEHPAALVLLASVPALLMILLTTWLLRRRQSDLEEHMILTGVSDSDEVIEEVELSDEEASAALERELMGGLSHEDESLLDDDPFKDFEDEEGANLDQLSDELLMPGIAPDPNLEDDFGVHLDEGDFTQGDLDSAEDEIEPSFDTLGAFDNLDEPQAQTQETREQEASSSGALEQDELDRLLMGELEASESENSWDELDFSTDAEQSADQSADTDAKDEHLDTSDSVGTSTEQVEVSSDDDIDALLNEHASLEEQAVPEAQTDDPEVWEAEHELVPEEEALDPFDPDVLLDEFEKVKAEQAAKSEKNLTEAQEVKTTPESVESRPEQELQAPENDLVEAEDIDDLLASLGVNDADIDDIDPEEVEKILAELSDDGLNETTENEEVANEQASETDVPDTGSDEFVFEEEPTPTSDTRAEHLKEYASNEALDEALLDFDEYELSQAESVAESDLDALFELDESAEINEAQAEREEADGAAAPESNETNDFLDIDSILADVEAAPLSDEDEDDDSERAEDQLAVQLDLARAYLDMGEIDSAREAVETVLAGDDLDLHDEAHALLARIDGE